MFRSRALSYAILAATEVAKRGDGAGIQAANIAAACDLPTAHGAKIMSQLAKAHVFRSDRGARGGFQLARAANKITLLEIYEAVHGTLGQDAASSLPPALAKPVNAAFDATYGVIRKRLEGVSLGDLMKK